MKEFLDAASRAYYEGSPIMSDEEFDLLAEKHKYYSVGYSGGFDAPHIFPMYSLQKAFVGEKEPPELGEEAIVTPKLDGAAVSVVYLGGRLYQALTRGDGKQGNLITEKMEFLVPGQIDHMGLVQITGEVVAPKTIPNARNFASGSLNLKSVEEFSARDLRFIAYDMQGGQTEELEYWTDSLVQLVSWGFDTVLQSNWSEYPQDGLVFRVNSRSKYKEMGYTAHHPRGAYALKERPAGVITKLLDVVWQVGKSGVVSPVAILDPVVIGEATISRATLHNMKYITELDLEIGCFVEVIRSGDIIPRVVKRIEGDPECL